MKSIFRKLLDRLTKEEAIEILLSKEYFDKVKAWIDPKLFVEMIRNYLESLSKDQLVEILSNFEDINEAKKSVAKSKPVADPCSRGFGSRSC